VEEKGEMSASVWELDPSSITKFLSAVAQFLPEAHTASFEIRGACAEAKKVYAEHQSAKKYRPIRDTVFPRTQLYYCAISEKLSEALDRVLVEEEPAKVFWHIKGFDDQHMLFSIHDADTGGSVCFSPKVDSKVVGKIATALSSEVEKIETRYDWEQDCRPRVKR
jgi:hypothetical protein